MHDKKEYLELDIIDIIKIIKRYIKFLIIVPLLFAIAGYLISIYLLDSIYVASTTIIVRQNKVEGEELSKTDVDLSKSLIFTYAEMAKSNTVLNNTKRVLNLDILNKDLISISPVKDTQILKIEVQSQEPESAMNIANTLVQEFTHEIIRITKTDNVAIVDYAVLPERPVKPNKIMNTFISAMLGEALTLLFIFLIEYFDNTIKSEKDIEKYLKISLVGTIPNFNQGGEMGYEYGKIYGESTSKLCNN